MALFELTAEFIVAEGIWLDPQDLRDGFERGFLKASGVVDLAAHEVRSRASDPVLMELAALLRDELERVPDVLRAVDGTVGVHDPQKAARKWLYLQLKAAYCARDQLSDPLGVVEAIYADFDYPPSVALFVRYMPLRPGDAAGKGALMARWAAFLNLEHEALARQPH
jgi:hypothetical protein